MVETIQLDDLSVMVLDALAHDKIEEYYAIKTVLNKKKVCNYPYKGKYIKYYGCNGDGPVYMKVDGCSVTMDEDRQPYLYLHGHGFESSFTEFDDGCFVHWSTWQTIREPLRFIEERAEENKKKLEENPDYIPSYYFFVITKDEFIEAFNKMHCELAKRFLDFLD